MRLRFLTAFVICLLPLIGGTSGFAQTSDPESKTQKLQSIEREDERRAARLDALFEDLKQAENPQVANRIAHRIWGLWFQSGSKSVDLFMTRAKKAISEQRFSLALDLLDTVIATKPTYSEGWNARATLHFMMKNYGKSIADIEQTLALEPRHFGALAGLGLIMTQLEDYKRAITAYEFALEVHPQMRNGHEAIKSLKKKLNTES